MSMNREGRATRPESAEASVDTWTGNRALMLEEPLIFEMDARGGTGVDFAGAPKVKSLFAGLNGRADAGLPGWSDRQTVAPFRRLGAQNYVLTLAPFPPGRARMS